MSKTKWIMKQYWRVGTIRAVLALILSMLVLGRLYYVHIPVISDMGVFGALILGSILVLVFLGLGWVYDEKMKLWSSQQQAAKERSAYAYIPDYRTLAIDYAFYNALLQSIRNILERMTLETKAIDDLLIYFEKYFARTTSRHDIFAATPDSTNFIETHRFTDSFEHYKRKISLGARAKLGFQVQLIRLTWIQSLTGLVQDVLVFGAMSMTVIYFGGVEGVLPVETLFLSILLISIPLFVFLTALGWIYDKKLRVWSPNVLVIVERNPYTYLAEPSMHIQTFPIFNVILRTLRDILTAADVDSSNVERILQYISEYSQLDVTQDENMKKARDLRTSFGELFY